MWKAVEAWEQREFTCPFVGTGGAGSQAGWVDLERQKGGTKLAQTWVSCGDCLGQGFGEGSV